MRISSRLIRLTLLTAMVFAARSSAGVQADSPPGANIHALASVGPQGIAAQGWSYRPAISADGRFVAFSSSAANLVPGDTNATWDVFVRDVDDGATQRVSVGSQGEQADGPSGNWSNPAISADGRWVAFASLAGNLAADDHNGAADVFLHDRETGQTVLVSRGTDGKPANGWSDWPAISPDGRFVSFTSLADNLVSGDTNAARDIFLFDRESGSIQRVSLSDGGQQARRGAGWASAVSRDGRYVAFPSPSPDLVKNDTNGAWDIFLRDVAAGKTLLISQSTGGAIGDGDSGATGGLAMSADGSVVAFQSQATNLVLGDTNRKTDIFVREWKNGATRRSSLDAKGKESKLDCVWPALSPDGRFVTFTCLSGLVKTDDNGAWDVFLRDRLNHVTSLVSTAIALRKGNQNSGLWGSSPVSEGGRFVAFASLASNLAGGDTDEDWDVYRADVLETRRARIVQMAVIDTGMPYCTVAASPRRGCSQEGGCGGTFHGYLCGVCTDVVLDAYREGGGYDVQAAQAGDAQRHPEHTYVEGGTRNAHDMWLYFRYSGQDLPAGTPYLPGDAAFFDWDEDGLAEHVALVVKVNAAGQPARLMDASGDVGSNPGGLAQEMSWQSFHTGGLVGHARLGGLSGIAPVISP